MRQIQEILRLKHQNQLSIREIARSCQLPLSTVWEYLIRAQSAGLTWPLPEGLSEIEVHQRLFGVSTQPPEPTPGLPDWAAIHHASRTRARTNPDTSPDQSEHRYDQSEQAHGVIRTPARTNPDTITTALSKLYGFDRAAVRFHSERCTLWIVTPYAFAPGRRNSQLV